MYQELFDFFQQEHNLILTEGELDDIIYAVTKFLQRESEDEAEEIRKEMKLKDDYIKDLQKGYDH